MSKWLCIWCLSWLVAACGEGQGAPRIKETEAKKLSISALEERLEPRLSRSSERLQSFEHPSGVRVIRLNGAFQTMTAIRRRPDGTFEQGCFDDAKRAARFLAGGQRDGR